MTIFVPIDKVETCKDVRAQLFEILQATNRSLAPDSADALELGVLEASGELPATPLAPADKVDGSRVLVWKTADEPDFSLIAYPEFEEE